MNNRVSLSAILFELISRCISISFYVLKAISLLVKLSDLFLSRCILDDASERLWDLMILVHHLELIVWCVDWSGWVSI
ncbi:hypothetical protein D3C86_2119800 [compost metagenome]